MAPAAPTPPDPSKGEKAGQGKTSRSIKTRIKRALLHVRAKVPPGLRLVLGILLIGGGILGFLPILGFWMLPLGIAVAMLDIGPV